MNIEAKLHKTDTHCILISEIGQFEIDNKTNYPKGRHKGIFTLAKIYPSSSVVKGQVRVVIRADVEQAFFKSKEVVLKSRPKAKDENQLDLVLFNGAAEEAEAVALTTAETSTIENDVVPVEDRVLPVSVTEVKTSTPVEAITDKSVNSKTIADLGMPYPLPEKYHIDRTLDRGAIAQQVKALRESGYIMDAKNQVWHKRAA